MSTNPGAYPPAHPSKRSNVLIWILVGVGCVFLLCVAAVIGGGLFLAHQVKEATGISSADAGSGKVILKKEDKEIVISSDKANSGNNSSLEIKSAEGSMRMGAGTSAKLPSWLPAYPGAAPQDVYSAQTKEGVSGSFGFNTFDSASKIVEFYEARFKSAGLKITNSAQSPPVSMVSAEDEGKKHTAAVIIGQAGDKTSVIVNYVER